VRLRGLGVGIVGVACLVGIDSLTGHIDGLSVVELLLVAVGYAAAPVIANTVLADVPSMGVIAISVAVVAALYLPWTV
jgi:proteasome assembly chaperone (PAC2) family protein